MSHHSQRLGAAAIAAVLALSLYGSTLLPGQDLGDTASFQALAGERFPTPRQGYPLYFAVTGLFVRALPLEHAHAANLASAVLSALAVGVLVLVGAELAGSLAAGLVGALLFAASYTFWSHAIIAEVYALHLLVVALCLLALLGWERRPTAGRLASFFLLVGLGFGNHLSMVLLLPGFTLFLLLAAPGGPRSLLRPRVVLLAAAIAGACALQYAWNLAVVLGDPSRPEPLEVLRSFWFDVTKSDWRATMVAAIPRQRMTARAAMYWFDVRQQVGVAGALAACAGVVFLLRRDRRRGILLVTLWLVNWLFAFTYNVGDAYVFYLPSHLLLALAAGCGAAWALSFRPTAVLRFTLTALLLLYPAWRAWDAWPALDRSGDTAPREYFDRLTMGISDTREIMGADLNWQLHNGLDYYTRHTRPGLDAFDAPPSLLRLPFIAWANQEMNRTLVLTQESADVVSGMFGTLLAIERDARLPAPTLLERLAPLPDRTPYVLTVLQAYPESPLDERELAAVGRRLGVDAPGLPRGRYVAVAGTIGRPPTLRLARDRPFRTRVTIDGHPLDIRMESWLPTDSIRRAGFGHVTSGRNHLLTIDRGISFLALAPGGRIQLRTWQGGLYTPLPRFIVRTSGRRPPGDGA